MVRCCHHPLAPLSLWQNQYGQLLCIQSAALDFWLNVVPNFFVCSKFHTQLLARYLYWDRMVLHESCTAPAPSDAHHCLAGCWVTLHRSVLSTLAELQIIFEDGSFCPSRA